MNFDLDENQTLFKATVERFAGTGDAVIYRAARALPGGIDPARWQECATLGLLGLPAAESHGGIGGSTLDCAVVAEALGRGMIPEPWLEAAYLPLRMLAGTAAGAGLSTRIASGAERVAVAFAEPGQRYRTEPKLVRAARRDGGWTIAGTKSFVLAGDGATTYLVTAATDDGAALFAVPAALGQARGYRLVDGSRAVELTFYDAIVDDAAHVGDAAGIATAVSEARLMAAAEMLGLAQKLFDDTLIYVRERRQFGQPIGRFQSIQHRLVDAYALLEQMRSMLWRTVMAGLGDGSAARGAKAFIADGALHIGHEAIQLHGGMGVSDDLAVGHAHKRILLLSKLFGDPADDLLAFAVAA